MISNIDDEIFLCLLSVLSIYVEFSLHWTMQAIPMCIVSVADYLIVW